MKELKVFESIDFGKIRVIEIDGEPWFVGKDIAGVLGYTDAFGALKKHVDDEDKQNCQNDSFETPRGLTIINESGVYSLILSSKLPSAKNFKRWVTSEVLPSIRENGTYSITQKPDSYMIDDPIERAKRWIEEKEAYLALESKVKEDEPYVTFAKHVTESSDAVDIGEFAKIAKNEVVDMGRNRLFAWLRHNGYLMNNNTPYQKYLDNGYFEVIEVTKETAYGTKLFPKTLITGKGQIAIIERLRKEFGATA